MYERATHQGRLVVSVMAFWLLGEYPWRQAWVGLCNGLGEIGSIGAYIEKCSHCSLYTFLGLYDYS